MLRKLLGSVFSLMCTTKIVLSDDALVLAHTDGKPRPQLHKSETDCDAERAAGRGRGPMRPDGPQQPDGGAIPCGIQWHPATWSSGVPASDSSQDAGMFVGRVVVDHTGLAGAYDFNLHPDAPQHAQSSTRCARGADRSKRTVNLHRAAGTARAQARFRRRARSASAIYCASILTRTQLAATALVIALSAVRLTAAATVLGQVTFAGVPVPGATVTATQGDVTRATITDEEGVYRLADLADGPWTVRVTMLGFFPLEQEVVVVAVLPVADDPPCSR